MSVDRRISGPLGLVPRMGQEVDLGTSMGWMYDRQMDSRFETLVLKHK